MSISGEVPGEGSDGEEVFINEEDIIHEIPIDEEDLPDQDDDDDDDEEEDDRMDGVDDSAYAFRGHTDEVFAAACSPIDSSLVVSGGKDDRGFLWRIGSDVDVQELTGHQDTVCTVAFSSDGKLVACGSMDGQINVWNTATRILQGTLEGSSGSGFEWLRWHPRGHLIIAGSEDCNIWMWNADHNAFLNTFAGHSSTVTCGDFTPDGKVICSGSDDASLRIWDPKSAQSRHVVRGHGYHTQGLTCLAITSDSQSIVSGSMDNSVHIVNINSGQVVGSLVGHTNSVECIDISSRYNWVATGSIDKTLIIWDLAHQAIRSTCEHDEGVTCLVWLGSSRYVASGCIDGMVRIWDSLSGELAQMFSGHRDVVQSLAISADGNSIVSVSSDRTARVFDISMFKWKNTSQRIGQTIFWVSLGYGSLQIMLPQVWSENLDLQFLYYSSNLLRRLYYDYYFTRQENLWRQNVLKTLPVLLDSSDLLACGEDLALIPARVHPVMQELGLIGLRIQRMHSEPNLEFGVPSQYNYMTEKYTLNQMINCVEYLFWFALPHVMIAPHCLVGGRREKNSLLQDCNWQRQRAPSSSTPEEIHFIVQQHFDAPSLWAIFPLQDILALKDKSTTRPAVEETINDHTNPKHYWRFRKSIFFLKAIALCYLSCLSGGIVRLLNIFIVSCHHLMWSYAHHERWHSCLYHQPLTS